MTAIQARIALIAAFLLVAGAAGWAVGESERILSQGRPVLVELAPVDPRSLMQGDYMALRYAPDRQLPAWQPDQPPPPAYAYLALDGEGRARLVGLGDTARPPAGQVAMKLRRRDQGYSIGPNAFFFQEGRGDRYAQARWGEFRVAEGGKALLTHLRDAELRPLGENRR